MKTLYGILSLKSVMFIIVSNKAFQVCFPYMAEGYGNNPENFLHRIMDYARRSI